jgi:hypothetical protein
MKFFKEEDLPGFLEYGPDDCHVFQLQQIDMPKSAYLDLCNWVEHESEGDNSNKLRELLIDIYEDVYITKTLFSTDGCSDNYELLLFYADKHGLDYEDCDVAAEIQEKLYSDDELYMKTLKEYIRHNY